MAQPNKIATRKQYFQHLTSSWDNISLETDTVSENFFKSAKLIQKSGPPIWVVVKLPVTNQTRSATLPVCQLISAQSSLIIVIYRIWVPQQICPKDHWGYSKLTTRWSFKFFELPEAIFSVKVHIEQISLRPNLFLCIYLCGWVF